MWTIGSPMGLELFGSTFFFLSVTVWGQCEQRIDVCGHRWATQCLSPRRRQQWHVLHVHPCLAHPRAHKLHIPYGIAQAKDTEGNETTSGQMFLNFMSMFGTEQVDPQQSSPLADVCCSLPLESLARNCFNSFKNHEPARFRFVPVAVRFAPSRTSHPLIFWTLSRPPPTGAQERAQLLPRRC